MLTFADFQASGRDIADLSAVHDFIGGGAPVPARLYTGDAYIEPMGAQWMLTLHNMQYVGTLVDMEALLYLWCLEECACDMSIGDDVAQTLCIIDSVIGFETLADIIATPREQGGSIAALDAVCDVPECAMIATGNEDETDEATLDAMDDIAVDVWDLVSDNDFATDDTRSHGDIK